MHTHPSDLLALEAPAGGLILTPCPGTKDVDTEAALKQLKAVGASAVITLMPDAEMVSNAVTELPTLCAQNELQWFHLPIEDDHAPAENFAVAWQAQRAAVHQLLDAGKRVAVHCKGGSGRTGLMVAQILVERGYGKEDALAAVKALRPKALSLAVHQDYLARLPVAA